MARGEGNPQLEDGFARVANEILEALARTPLSDHESRCVHFLWRKTYGWHSNGESKKVDMISHSQWAEGTGIDRRHVARVLNHLVQRKIFIKEIVSVGKRKVILWGFQKHYLQWTGDNRSRDGWERLTEVSPPQGAVEANLSPPQGASRTQLSPPVGKGVTTPGGKSVTTPGDYKRKKERLQKTLLPGEKEILDFLPKLTCWDSQEGDLEWIREFRADNNGFGLEALKACRDYWSGKAAPKHKGVWKNRLRNWLKVQGDIDARGGPRGKPSSRSLPTGDQLRRQAKEKGVIL